MTKYMMCHLTKKKNIIIYLFALILILTSIFPGSSVCSEHRRVKPEWVMPEHYPEWFHGWGRIGYFNETEIVINDMDYRLSPEAKFHTPDHIVASRYEFTAGKLAGFLFNDDGEIISLWMITMKK